MAYNWDEKPELNITPLVDVMLVLLAIMMVIAPNMIYEEKINLPQSSKTKSIFCSKNRIAILSQGRK